MIPRALRPWKAHAAFRWPERIHRMTHLLQWNDRFVIIDAPAVSMSCWRPSEIRRQVRAVLERDSRRGLGVHFASGKTSATGRSARRWAPTRSIHQRASATSGGPRSCDAAEQYGSTPEGAGDPFRSAWTIQFSSTYRIALAASRGDTKRCAWY